MTLKFKKGDKVKLKKNSEFVGQSNGCIGTIMGIQGGKYCYFVKWGKYTYDYRENDLICGKIINWKDRLK